MVGVVEEMVGEVEMEDVLAVVEVEGMTGRSTFGRQLIQQFR